MNTLYPKIVPVIYEDGTQADLAVTQIKIKDYDTAIRQTENEFALAALATGKDEGSLKTLTPESFEALWAAVQEANEKGFFAFAGRRLQRGLQTLAALPVELLPEQFQKARSNLNAPSAATPLKPA